MRISNFIIVFIRLPTDPMRNHLRQTETGIQSKKPSYCMLLCHLPFAADEDPRLDLERLGSLGSTSLLQFLPELLGTLTEDNKGGLSPSSYNPRENIKETFYGNHPRIALLGRFLTKDRKQYKKRGNLSECFWKYCV
ncbi:urotensin-2 isoform X1 [Pezoporus occidentalis]|uniref:urotensin-2 isoform X1 n=1 Tax=Pezoporus occidentalis TaxID=407982 RepID=UPI002F9189A3